MCPSQHEVPQASTAAALAGGLVAFGAARCTPSLDAGLSPPRRDAFGAAVVALSLLLAVFVLGPVTFDRSIYIFLLSQFELAGTPLSQQALRNTFIRTYIDGWDQVGRRLREQEISGNLEDTPQGWLSPRAAAS
jgi:hypothetical protein